MKKLVLPANFSGSFRFNSCEYYLSVLFLENYCNVYEPDVLFGPIDYIRD